MTIPFRAVGALTITLMVMLLDPALSAQPSRARATRAGRVSLGMLSPGQRVDGFRSAAIYLNDADRPMGGRFIHERSGFVLDLLQIQSVPQGFIWTITLPTSASMCRGVMSRRMASARQTFTHSWHSEQTPQSRQRPVL